MKKMYFFLNTNKSTCMYECNIMTQQILSRLGQCAVNIIAHQSGAQFTISIFYEHHSTTTYSIPYNVLTCNILYLSILSSLNSDCKPELKYF